MNVQYFDVEGIMKVELTINKSKDLPRGAIAGHVCLFRTGRYPDIIGPYINHCDITFKPSPALVVVGRISMWPVI